MVFTTNGASSSTSFDQIAGVDVLNKKSIAKLTYQVGTEDATYDIKTSELDKLAADVAGWLSKNGYASTDDVFAAEKTAGDIAKLVGAYNAFANNGYAYDATNSLNPPV